MTIDPDAISSNPSDNPEFSDILAARLSRRGVLARRPRRGRDRVPRRRRSAGPATAAGRGRARRPGPLLGFTPVPTSTADAVVVPDGLRRRGAHPVGHAAARRRPGVAARTRSNTAAEQAQQVGVQPRRHALLPARRRAASASRRGLLVLNHEYTDADQIYTTPTATHADDADGEGAKALAGHGVTRRRDRERDDGTWEHVRTRRTTGASPARRRWRSRARSAPTTRCCSPNRPAPIGTLNNCAHGVTPWGTYLACEENWNGYFGTDDADVDADAARGPLRRRPRPASATTGTRPTRASTSPRTATSSTGSAGSSRSTRSTRDSTPVKRTALGRIKHEGATGHRVARPRRRLHRRRPERRLPLQVRRQRALAAAAGAAARARSTTARSTSPSSTTTAPARGCRSCTAGRAHRANGWVDQADVLHPHPAGRRRRRRDQAGPPGVGRRATRAPATSSSR